MAAPSFQPINHDESYAYLADPVARTSTWSKLKYAPVGGEDGPVWASFGGELRLRAERKDNERFGRGLQDHGGDFQTRVRLWAELNLGTSLRAFVDVQDARTSGLDSGEPASEESRTDLHQAFIEARTELAGGRLRVRAGRQEMGIAPYRLVDVREGANARRALDLVRVLYDSPTGWSGDAFAGYALREGKASWDDATDFDYRLYGATAAKTLGQGATAPKLTLGANTAGLWRQSKDDGLYALSSMVLRGANEGQSSYVGWRTGVFARYALTPHISLMGVANYTKAGDFLKETGTAKDQSYLGTFLTFRF
ncbi:alginate export family protein [Brevundimonas sp.]|uniref:alginate export family protein n=1 Tax=Brevundimonas sp. TaxID=1871086 RepID=UPI003D6D2EDF